MDSFMDIFTHFTPDNTQGYTPEELRTLNTELREVLKGYDPFTESWYERITRFEQEVSDR